MSSLPRLRSLLRRRLVWTAITALVIGIVSWPLGDRDPLRRARLLLGLCAARLGLVASRAGTNSSGELASLVVLLLALELLSRTQQPGRIWLVAGSALPGLPDSVCSNLLRSPVGLSPAG